MTVNDPEPTGSGSSSIDDAAAGRAAAERIYRYGPDEPIDERFSLVFAEAALSELSRLLTQDMPGLLKAMLEGATVSAEQLNVEGLAGLVEILQNADDERASEVRLALRLSEGGLELLVAHNGERVGFADTAGMALAYISTKRQDARAKGKFGIGLKTLGRISSGMAVHCQPYHFEVAEHGPRLVSAEPPIPGFFAPEALETLLVLRLREGITAQTLESWFDEFDPGALLFLDTVRAVRFIGESRTDRRERRLEVEALGTEEVLGWPIQVERLLDAGTDRVWIRYAAEVKRPSHVHRTAKTTASQVPIAIAVPTSSEPGRVHAGLPVSVRTQLPYSINAQFDPDTARSRLQHESWNAWLIEVLGHLVARVALLRAAASPATAWAVVPLAEEAPLAADPWLEARLRAHVEVVQGVVGESIRLAAHDGSAGLEELAYEAELLDGLLSLGDIAALGKGQPFPASARDPEGRWRLILDELALSTRVEVEDAVELFDTENRRAPSWYGELLGAALAADLGAVVSDRPCLVLSDRTRVVPPLDARHGVVLASPAHGPGADLLIALGVGMRLHAEFLDGERGSAVVAWLKKRGTIHTDLSPETALRILGEHHVVVEPSDDDVRRIRDLVASIDDARQTRLAPGLGRTLSLDGYSFVDGVRTEGKVVPSKAYLPSRIEGGSGGWAPTAGVADGLMWIDGRYSGVLRPRYSGDLGARAFLALLGAGVAPRLTAPSRVEHRYNDPAYPIDRLANGRLQALAVTELASQHPRGKRATHLQQDKVSPDLEAVVDVISSLPVPARRDRARGLLATVTRAWRRQYADFEHAVAVYSDYRWSRLGEVPATWLSRLASAPWLSDQAGAPKAPIELAVRTPEMLNVFGEQPEWYAAEVDADRDLTVLEALGMKTEPTTEDILRELSDLRDAHQGGDEVDPTDAARLYLALAQRCPPSGTAEQTSFVGELTVAQLRGRFGISRRHAGLLFWKNEWWPPAAVYRGEPIFGERRPFVPHQPQLEPLWQVLSLREPRPEVCLDVLREIAMEPLQPQERGVLLQTYRYLSRYSETGTKWRAALGSMPLWTAQGWTTSRPVYAIEDRALREALAEHLSMWIPPGGLDTFADFPRWAGVVLLDRGDFALRGLTPEARQAGSQAAATYTTAVQHLHDMLLAEDPSLHAAFTGVWQELAAAPVALTADLAVEVTMPTGATVVVSVGAHVTRDPLVVCARSVDELRDSEFGGAALASLFGTPGDDGVDRMKVALLWEKAWRRSEQGEVPDHLEVMRSEENGDALADFEAELKQPRKTKRQVKKPAGPEPIEQLGDTPPTTRHLKTAIEVDVEGISVGEGSSATKTRPAKRPLKSKLPPERAQQAPRTAPAAFTQKDVETYAKELLRDVLRTRDISELRDFRNQHGIGADAVDELLRFFEIKAFARDMPDEVSLTAAEAERASEKGDAYFLAVISGLEQGWTTRMRIFQRPLNALEWRPSTSLHLGGIRTRRAIDVPFKDVTDASDGDTEDELDGSDSN